MRRGPQKLDGASGFESRRLHSASEQVRRGERVATVTGLSVAVALLIGTIELGGLVASQLGLSGSFWSYVENIDLNTVGFMIVGLFVATWAFALAVWKYARIEERWSSSLL